MSKRGQARQIGWRSTLPVVKTGITRLPADVEGSSGTLGGTGTGISLHSTHRQEAIALLRFQLRSLIDEGEKNHGPGGPTQDEFFNPPSISGSDAHNIEAEFIYADRLFRLRIRDDGTGIEPAMLEAGRSGHYGLPGMRERARQIGAEFTIWSRVGTGTEIDSSIPGSIAYSTLPRRRFGRLRETVE